MWDERNWKLHETPISADLEGQAVLDVAMKKELSLGRSRLPVRYGYLFDFSPLPLLSKPLRWKKNWFRTVRRAREKYKDPELIEDAFSEKKDKANYFRRWLKLDH